MEITARLVCLLLALVCFAAAFFLSVREPPAVRYDLVAAGLALMTLAFILG